jgi:FdhD protein
VARRPHRRRGAPRAAHRRRAADGDDANPRRRLDLAVGFLIGEGIIESATEVTAIRACATTDPESAGNVVDVTLGAGVVPAHAARRFTITSACGVCGRTRIEEVRQRLRWEVCDDPLRLSPTRLARLPELLRAEQRAFARTGGLHAAALFDTATELVCLREDVGRHNAFDKVIGWAATRGLLPLRSHVILASGRASFELTQKALLAGIPMLAAVSAPSSLAVELAADAGMTLIGFLRGERMNVYTGSHRVSG